MSHNTQLEPAETLPFAQSPAEYLYHSLDGRVFSASDGKWRTRVFGVLTEGEDLWVQMVLAGSDTHSLLLRAKNDTRAADALRALQFWVGHPQVQQERVIEVEKVVPGQG